MQQHAISSYTRPNFAALFTPKLVTVLRKGYGAAELRRDAIAGLTVAIVALPLSMAIAIASGATPAHGLYTAIVGGFLVSALGGSRFQIGGPAGAFIVLVAATAAQTWHVWRDTGHIPFGGDAGGTWDAAAGQFHQIHSLSDDCGLYGRHRGDHLCQPDKAAFGPEFTARAGAIAAKAVGALGCAGHGFAQCGSGGGRHNSGHCSTAAMAAPLAGNAGGGGAGICGLRGVQFADCHHFQPVRRHSFGAANAAFACVFIGETATGFPGGGVIHAAGRD